MSTAAAHTHLSVEEFLERPERWDGFYEELIEGEVIVSPNIKPVHSEIARRLHELLLPLQKQGFVVLGEVACRVSDDSLPNTDACVVRCERWEAALATNDFLRESPALVIEIASPSNRGLRRKAILYLEHGAEQVWVIYPKTNTVLVMTPDGDREARTGESVEFHDLRIPVADVFAAKP